MLPNIIKLSFRAIRNTELLRTTDLRSTMKCNYARWVSRRPSAILNEHELYDSEDTTTMKEVHKKAAKRAREERLEIKKKAKREAKEKEKNEETVTKEPLYKALKEDDRLISSLMIDIKTKKKRHKSNLMMLEGLRLINDAIQAGMTPEIIFFSRVFDVLSLSLPQGVQLYKIPYRTIQLWSNLTTSPGIIGIFKIPNIEDKKPADDAIPLTIICDNIREPGNLGTIIRIAAAVGCEKLLLMKGCVDLWEPKVLRSAAGAHFRLPIVTSLSWGEIPMLISNESDLFLADNIIGYENELKNHTTDKESDTVAVINDNNIEEDHSDENIDSNSINDKIGQLITKSDKPTAKSKLFVKKIISQLPVISHYMYDFTKKEIVLVIGGETESISLQSCELLCERNCTRVNISLTNGVDSLNVASAISIIAFEIKRQFMTRKMNKE